MQRGAQRAPLRTRQPEGKTAYADPPVAMSVVSFLPPPS